MSTSGYDRYVATLEGTLSKKLVADIEESAEDFERPEREKQAYFVAVRRAKQQVRSRQAH